MAGHHFLSYDRSEGAEHAARLREALQGATPSFPVWMDRHDLKLGKEWDDQVVEAIRGCASLLFVMTAESVESQSKCKKEWSRALAYKKPVIPLLFERGLEVPFLLQDRHYLDFTGSFDDAVAQLREHLAWLTSPPGVLQTLQNRLADARRDLRRATDPAERQRALEDVAALEEQVAEQQRLVDDPAAVARGAAEDLARGMERDRQGRPAAAAATRIRFINPPPTVAPAYFQDRQTEMGLLTDFLNNDAVRLVWVVGRGGVGKTTLVCRTLTAAAGRLPELGGVVCLGGNSTHRVSMANLLSDLGRLLPAEKTAELDALFKNPQADQGTRMRSLLAAPFPAGRVLLLLDSFEDLIDPETQQINDGEVAGALRAILTLPPHAVKMIVTTRLVARDLALVQPSRQGRLDIDEGLPSPHAENVLRAMDADGKLGLKSAPAEMLAEARRRTGGYPRALEALFAILSADRGTSLRDLLADPEKPLPENVVEALVGEAFARLDGRAQQVMQALAVYGRPVTAVAVDYLLQSYLTGLNSQAVLNRLVNLRLAHKEADRYGLHPADRVCALGRVPRGRPEDRATGEAPPFTQLALLRRAADYFHEVGKPRAAWQGPADLGPYLAELELRQAAQDHEAVTAILKEMEQPLPAPDAHVPPAILVVDDSPMDRHTVGALLERLPARVAKASNGLHALEILKQEPFDLVVTDLVMPEMDGLELVEKIRAGYPQVPVILMTGHGNEEIALQALQKGAASYVPRAQVVSPLFAESVRSVLAVGQASRQQERLLERLARTEWDFILDNDPSLIEPLISHLQENLSRMKLCDETGRLRVGIALQEALLNAIERGNLEVPSDLREKDNRAYLQLIEERRRHPDHRDRRVFVSARETLAEAVYVIRDEGPGFDPSLLPDPTDPANLERVTCRGLLLIRTFMDEVSHNDKGNEITMVKRASRQGEGR
jgi:CheY-like chemotaxis protein/anti-sigma regulatory factor (Ser/Thr protein kinase)